MTSTIPRERSPFRAGPGSREKYGRRGAGQALSLPALSLTLASLILAALLLLLTGCAEEVVRPKTEMDFVRDEEFSLKNLGKPNVMATGVGCSGSERDALTGARKMAHYNLRSVAGAKIVGVRYKILREIPDPDRYCVEVEAMALE